ncbi:hypothetical protein C4D60_Mb03t04790 [Musa balbisiana]|uniref:Protein GLUTAMINE DUMPER 3 n=1 Tax=Musa balbisiana TaxID=52838 RepID=A0A4S8J7J8_MUSBA|nr:hypothetical protein C4D60_Mb03t04790 [Musa balbisiana]
MRAGAGFNATAVAAAAAPVVTGAGDHLTWHSPVPYLFGGLAAMLGLIALALLILACSYWKLSGYIEGGEDTGSGVELYVKPVAAPTVYEEKVVVIMAGDAKPTGTEKVESYDELVQLVTRLQFDHGWHKLLPQPLLAKRPAVAVAVAVMAVGQLVG